MNIIIVGAGTVGLSLAEYFLSAKHQISIIDQNYELISEIGSKLDVFALQGSGTYPSVLEKANIKNADMFIAVTPSDDVNLLCCHFAKQYGVPKRIARVVSDEYTLSNTKVSLKELGVTHVIEPEKEVVSNIIQYIELPGVTESANFQADNIYLRGYKISADMPLANKALYDVTELANNAQLLIVLIIRDGKAILPSGKDVIIPGDEIFAIMPDESLQAFRKLINQDEVKIKKVIVFGDSLTAIHLVEAIQSIAERTILVDPNQEHGRNAASYLNNIEVFHGDCTNVEMLQEVGVRECSFFIAAGTDSEDNIMASLLAKAEGAKMVIAITTNKRHSKLFHSLGIDYIINPQTITTQEIITHIFRLPIGSLLSIKNANVHISRFVAEPHSQIIGKPLHAIQHLTKKSIIIGSVFRKDTVIIPSGKTVLEENDEVLVICTPEHVKATKKLFTSD